MMKKILIVSSVLIFCGGCGMYNSHVPTADYFYLNRDKNLANYGKVVLVQLDNHSSYPEISADVTSSLFEELQKKQIFSIRLVPQTDPVWRSLQLDLNSAYTIEQLVTARKALGCDAVLVGTVTRYSPYPHMMIGLRLKMIGLDDGHLIWAFEQIWDASDKKTEYRIKKYLESQTTVRSDTLGQRLVTMSPLKFLKFVSYEVARTL